MAELITWTRFKDSRGCFEETFKPEYLGQVFVQDNQSWSKRGVIRGLHYQPGMGKLMRVVCGAAYLVALNLRTGEHISIALTEEDSSAIWAPDYFARGFQALDNNTIIAYKCTDVYNPATEGAVRWDSVGIKWPLEPTIISPKDRTAPTFEQYRLDPKF